MIFKYVYTFNFQTNIFIKHFVKTFQEFGNISATMLHSALTGQENPIIGLTFDIYYRDAAKIEFNPKRTVKIFFMFQPFSHFKVEISETFSMRLYQGLRVNYAAYTIRTRSKQANILYFTARFYLVTFCWRRSSQIGSCQ